MALTQNNTGDASSFADLGLERFAPYLMNRIMGRYNATMRAQMSALGLSTAKMRALAILSIEDGLPITVLGVYAVIEQSTLSRALVGLEADGLVTRQASSEDQRSYCIYLTDEGRRINDQLWPQMRAGQESMFKGIDAQERAAFLATLKKMLANIRVHDF